MSCASYQGSLRALQQAHESNANMFGHIMSSLSSVVFSFDEFTESIPKIDISLPTQRRKTSFFSRLTGQIDFPDAEKQFSEQWKALFSEEFCDLPAFGTVFASFLPVVSEIWKTYEFGFRALEKRFVAALATIEREESKYNQANVKYRLFCEGVEERHSRVEQDPSKIGDFTETKVKYPRVVEEAIASLKRLNDQRLECGLEIERCLLEFEKIDRVRNEAVHGMFETLVQALAEYREKNKQLAVSLRNRVEAIAGTTDVEESLPAFGDSDEVVQLDSVLPGFDFDASKCVDLNKVFEKEISNGAKMATLADALGTLKAGETVLVINQSDDHCDVINVFHEQFSVESSQLVFP